MMVQSKWWVTKQSLMSTTTLHGNRFPSDALIQIIKQNGTRPIYFW